MQSVQKAKQRVIRRGSVPSEENIKNFEAKRYEQIQKLRHEKESVFTNPIERVVQSKYCHLNYAVRELIAVYKHLPQHVTVSMFYPNAKDSNGRVSPAMFDFPESSEDKLVCKQKREILKKAGYRYAIITKSKDGEEMDMQDIAEQLG